MSFLQVKRLKRYRGGGFGHERRVVGERSTQVAAGPWAGITAVRVEDVACRGDATEPDTLTASTLPVGPDEMLVFTCTGTAATDGHWCGTEGEIRHRDQTAAFSNNYHY